MFSPSVVDDHVRNMFDFPKVELHLHLAGAMRFETLLELSLAKHMPIEGARTVEELKRVLVTRQPACLANVLKAFDLFMPVIKGDAAAIERIAYELCEDQASEGVVYFEARYCPQLMILPGGSSDLDAAGVVRAVKRGLDKGQNDFQVTARSILACIRGHEQWANEILELCTSMKNEGVVAIDVAGCSSGADEQYEPGILKVFQEAARRGIHRTVHSGESGGAKEVILAINEMKAERVGHGYRILRNEAAYEKHFLKDRVHLEACPYSSIMTGSVPVDWRRHPISRWAADGANFSISRDDPTCFDNSVMSEMQLVHKDVGLSIHQIWKCQLNAAESSFLEEPFKAQLIAKVKAGEPPKEMSETHK